MILIEDTAISLAALPISEFKAHLRLGTGFTDAVLQDAVLESFLRSAITAIEARTGKALITRSFSWTLSDWRDDSGQALPIAPVTSVNAVTLIDATGTQTVVDAERYRLERDMHRPLLRPTSGVLPAVPTNGDVRVDFTAGLAADWGGLAADLGQAVMLLAAHYYEYRNETGLSGRCMPFGVSSLIERYRNIRVFGGVSP